MVAATRIKLSRLLITPERVEVKACCAPMTSEFNLEISAPVWVRVKNAIDCFCTCSKINLRRSYINPSPIRAENHLPIMLKSASSIAIIPTATANLVTSAESFGITPSSINFLSNNGVATIKKASITTVTKNRESDTLYGIANLAIRFNVPGFNF